ncbi:PrgH/EprH family type III secretion apparatus protein [Paludibacterium paludis]|uniref:Type III secretion system needle complex protein PrgH n=1 Tax=Paludibacterium paludis TaxID=1225769 RepID=A0A918UAQ5_9NEIS|nr:PrgH/EprH family type III secretion apparatus protein [Paludibacterium paludis]GGY23900.1 type III secretion system needle complex protein PrgH [Paludibacterium paludis]
MNEDFLKPVAPAAYTLRILGGALSGAEFELPAGRTLLVVGSETLLAPGADDAMPDMPEDALYLPSDTNGPNIELRLAEPDSVLAEPLSITIHAADGSRDEAAQLNRVLTAGTLRFAVRRIDEPWSEEVLGLAMTSPPAGTPLVSAPSRARRAALAALGFVAVAAIVAGACRFVWLANHPTVDQETASLAAMMTGTGQPCLIRESEGRMYVVAASEEDANWARQALVRTGKIAGVTVVSKEEESARLGRLLDERGTAWFVLRLEDPAHPVLLVSQDRSNTDAPSLLQLRGWLKHQLPYASSVSVETHSDAEVADVAREGLKRLAIPFDEIRHEGSVTFVTRGDLDDAALSRLRAFSGQFYRQWGSRYVHFSVELKEDWLKGKSYQYGSEGYVKLAPRQWYFPEPISPR